METIRIVQTRDVVVKKTMLDTYEFPSINLEREVVVEVSPMGRVFVNGTLLRGAKLASIDMSSPSFYNYEAPAYGRVSIYMPAGMLELRVREFIHLKGEAPSSAKLIQTQECLQ